MVKTAVVLFNLGGPDSPAAIGKFLLNLFLDPAILRVPDWLRPALARFIASRRTSKATDIYAQIGGRSPILEQTVAQAEALTGRLTDLGTVRCFVAMRYWHPLGIEAARAVREFGPDRVVLVPLYPQYSTTTTASSIADWRRAAAEVGLTAPTRTICCYADEAGLIEEQAARLRATLMQLPPVGRAAARVLFSAHGLPKKVVTQGDPYAWQVEQTARAVAAAAELPAASWRVSYQSRVGPVAWLTPYTEDEIAAAGRDRVPLVVHPIAFVSEHSETLVELDRTYAELAREKGVPEYLRVPTVQTGAAFIGGLASLVRRAVATDGPPHCGGSERCPQPFGGCGQRF
jgi:ferrochelatase